MRELIWHCMKCLRDEQIETELDLTTPGTRDGLFNITLPTHERRRIGLCARHAAYLWDLDRTPGLGEKHPGGTAVGAARFPYHVANRGRGARA